MAHTWYVTLLLSLLCFRLGYCLSPYTRAIETDPVGASMISRAPAKLHGPPRVVEDPLGFPRPPHAPQSSLPGGKVRKSGCPRWYQNA